MDRGLILRVTGRAERKIILVPCDDKRVIDAERVFCPPSATLNLDQLAKLAFVTWIYAPANGVRLAISAQSATPRRVLTTIPSNYTGLGAVVSVGDSGLDRLACSFYDPSNQVLDVDSKRRGSVRD